ncbi:MAG: 5-formyltetrahydrofolate cyclo-ligase [Microscillaceae bacterium]|nr:5-formyltetrahydrofolate cyclo-ligase [Microscillaceae bacterium]MDW8460429.1 5-formyltetrahydrofolate cyclo-ligase [Cytophagales bacterium]
MEQQTKKNLRGIFLKKRKELTEDCREQQSKQICELFFQYFNLTQIKYLHIFLPIESLKEINTWFIINKLSSDYPHLIISVPKTNPRDLSMQAHQLKPDTKLERGKLGTLEPTNSAIIQPHKIEMMLLPLLCFDENGYRLGYGKGFYDRFLKQCSPDIQKIGLSFFEPVAQIPELDEHDVPMNYCLTPKRLYSFL